MHPYNIGVQLASMDREVVRYTPEQLQRLRDSPLVHKPDGLPSIEQWMETPSEQNGRRPRSQVIRDSEQPSSSEARTERPPLMNMGMGHFARRSSTRKLTIDDFSTLTDKKQ